MEAVWSVPQQLAWAPAEDFSQGSQPPFMAPGALKRDYEEYAQGKVEFDANAVARAPVQASVAWRCIDAAHPLGCTACTEPPRVHQESCFELTGSGVSTSKEGEKARFGTT